MGQDRTDKDWTGAQPQHERDLGRGLGSSLDYSTRRTVLAHDGGRRGGWDCLPVCSFLHGTAVGPSPACLGR